MTLPLIELQINEETSFVDAVSIVEFPAIESNFLAFKKDTEQLNFALNEDRRELIGAALIPDIKIFRKHEAGNYFCFFSRNTIRKIAQVFFKNGFSNNMNVEHTDTSAESFVFQSYIVDSEMGFSAPKGIDVPDGTWIIGVKVNSDTLWQDIKSGKKQGFSVEGIFKMIDTKKSIQMASDDTIDEELAIALKNYADALQRIK